MPSINIPVTDPPDRLTFPPFPKAPPGTTIILFKDFKERGIQIFNQGPDGEELDGLGMPTVSLRVTHATDECKTESKQRKSAKSQFGDLGAGTAKESGAQRDKKEWWELWLEGEDLRTTSYDPHLPRIDQIHRAANDFRRSRTWPSGQSNVSYLWDQFRLYAGLMSNTPVWTRTDQAGPDDSDDSEDSGSEGEVLAATAAPAEPQPKKRLRPRPPYALYGETPAEVGSDAEVRTLLDDETLKREELLMDFLNDPERSIRVFLSSYMRRQGLIWSDRNLSSAPRLLSFFLHFLIRNRVLPDAHSERTLCRALDVVARAQVELPSTSALAKALPDEVAAACRECWGPRAEGYVQLEPVMEDPAPGVKDTDEEKDVDAREAKRARLDEVEIPGAKTDGDGDVAMANSTRRLGTETNSTWDADAPGWGGDTGGGAAAGTTWGGDGGADDPWAAQVVNWDPPTPHTLLPLLGPTALPLTHAPGVVEWGVRRVVGWAAPRGDAVPKAAVYEGGDAWGSAEAVEGELERRLGRVVLGPWVDWDKGGEELEHLARPRVLPTSRGRVVPVVLDGQAEEGKAAGGLKPHDPVRDEITLLVEPVALERLHEGMGLGGTWVQLARVSDIDGANAGEKKKEKKKGKGKKVPVEEKRYWYAEEVMMVIPSYYAN